MNKNHIDGIVFFIERAVDDILAYNGRPPGSAGEAVKV